MMPLSLNEQAPVPPPAYQRAQARLGPALHIDALTLVTTLHLLTLCRLAVRLAHRRCPPPLPVGRRVAPRTYSEESLLLLALLRTLWRLSYEDMRDWLRDWPALALVCGLPLGTDGRPRIPCPSQQWKRGQQAVIPWNPKRQKNRFCLPPTWTKEELGKRSAIERFFGRVFLFFHLQRPPLCGWSAIISQVALTYTATIVVALAAQQAGRPDLIRSPKRVLAHTWEECQW